MEPFTHARVYHWGGVAVMHAAIRYPHFTGTLQFALLFAMLYLMTYIPTGALYWIVMKVPADQSRAVSWIVYGIAFTFVPYGVTALLAYRYALHKNAPNAPFLYALAATQLVDKLALPFAGTLLASGFPASWYGRDFPLAGYQLLCEELPFYCGPYVERYVVWNTAAALMVFAAGWWMYRSRHRA